MPSLTKKQVDDLAKKIRDDHDFRVKAMRAHAAYLRIRSVQVPLKDDERDAIRELVAAAAQHERVCTTAPRYPEDSDTLRTMLAPLREDAEDS